MSQKPGKLCLKKLISWTIQKVDFKKNLWPDIRRRLEIKNKYGDTGHITVDRHCKILKTTHIQTVRI
jgi:hypothetical protein